MLNRLQNKLIKWKIRRYQDIDGWLSVREAIVLCQLSSLLPAGSTIVEIGSWKGKSTYCLARGLRCGGRVVAIDPFDASGEEGSAEIYQQKKGQHPLLNQFIEQMSKLRLINKIEILHGYSHEFVGRVPKINLLFIDGDHSKDGADLDFLNYSPFLVTGGHLLLHDFDATRKDLGPTWVVENRIIPYQQYQFIDLIDNLWIGKKYDLPLMYFC